MIRVDLLRGEFEAHFRETFGLPVEFASSFELFFSRRTAVKAPSNSSFHTAT